MNNQIHSIPNRFQSHTDILNHAVSAYSSWVNNFLKYQGRYEGNPNFLPVYNSDAKVKVHVNHYRDVVKNKQSYLGGNINLSIEDDRPEIQDLFRKLSILNNAQDQNSEMVAIASAQGIGYRLLYNHNSEVRWTNIHPENVIYMIGNGEEYDPDMAIYTYKDYREDTEYTIAELYDREMVYTYRYDNQWILEDEIPHLFSRVPIIPFYNNRESLPDAQPAISLMDSYDVTLSNSLSLIQQLIDSLLAIKSDNITLDENFIEQIKEYGLVLLGPEDSMAFIDRNINDTHVQNSLRLLKKNIYAVSQSIDYNDEDMSGNVPVVAYKQKLSRLESSSKTTERKFMSSLYAQYTLISEFYSTYRSLFFDPYSIQIEFNRTYPRNVAEEVQTLSTAINIMSTKDAYSLMSFIDDPNQWEERYRAEQEIYPDVNIVEDVPEIEDDRGTGE